MQSHTFILIKKMGERNFFYLLLFASYGFVGSTSLKQITSMGRDEVMFLGTGTDAFIEEGYYFLFFGLFTTRPGEHQDLQNKNVVLEPIEVRDKNGKKLKASADGEYMIEDGKKYQKFNEEEMNKNIQGLLKRTFIKLCATLDYEKDILGKDLKYYILPEEGEHPDPLAESKHKKEFADNCKKYGIKFVIFDPSVESANLAQDDLTYYRNLLTKTLNETTNLSDKDIQDTVEAQLGITQKIRFDSTGNVSPVVRVNARDSE